jgi:hypothetical protein
MLKLMLEGIRMAGKTVEKDTAVKVAASAVERT